MARVIRHRIDGRVLKTIEGESLRGANLSTADLSRADLRGAYLRRAKLAWSSHDLMAHLIQLAAADDLGLQSFAGLVLIRRDLCWPDFLALHDHAVFSPLLQRSLEILAGYIVDGDGAPDCVRQIADSRRQTTEAT